MKHKKFSLEKPQAGAQPAPNGQANPAVIDFKPGSEEVARKAYYTYVNEGSPLGRDVQHWLDAEARLTRDRILTSSPGFHTGR